MAAQDAIQTLSNSELAEGTMFTPRHVQLIKDQIMPKATDDELMLFIQVASHRGLDPFMKHIYAVSRRAKNEDGQWVDKWSYQVSIDGLRLIAQRSGRYRGQTEPQWCGDDGKWVDVWLKNEPPAAARIGVWIEGNPQPLMSVALYRNYVQTTKEGNPTKFWKDMPELMLSKCAEALALRKAFPEDAGGLYTSDEMGQAASDRPYIDADGVIEGTARPAKPAPRASAKVQELTPLDKAKIQLWDLASKTLGWNQDQLAAVGHKLIGAALAEADEERLVFIHDELLKLDDEGLDQLLATATSDKAA